MAKICSCSTGLGNTGLPNCYKPLTVPRGMFMVQTYDSTGAPNYIDFDDVIDDAYVLGKINETDTSKRWYPLQGIEAVASERGEPTYDTAPSGRKEFVKQGVRPFAFEIWDGGATLGKSLETGRCRQVSFFLIDSEGKLIGMDADEDGTKLYPIKAQKNSMVVSYSMASDTVVEKLKVSFDWDLLERDVLLSYMEAEAGVSLGGYSGLVDVDITYVGTTTPTTIVAKLYTNYGGLNERNLCTGLVIGDFTVNRLNNTPAEVTISAVSEENGVYTIVLSASQTDGDILQVTASKNGYDFAKLTTKTTTVVD